MKKIIFICLTIIIVISGIYLISNPQKSINNVQASKELYWFVLLRKSGIEYLYIGKPGDVNDSRLIKKFQVKTGAVGSPTPLPSLLGKKYWTIIKKESSAQNQETAPYFLQLNIPAPEEWPYGPIPYEECIDEYGNKIQCSWNLPGYFGLHGVNGNLSKLSDEDMGSSGCVRHSDEDITYLYNILNPNEEIRYYIEDI